MGVTGRDCQHCVTSCSIIHTGKCSYASTGHQASPQLLACLCDGAQVNALYADALAALQALPAEVPASHRRLMLPQLVQSLCRDLASTVVDRLDSSFEEQVLERFNTFKRGVLVSRPQFQLSPPTEDGEVAAIFDFAMHSGDDDVGDLQSEGSGGKLMSMLKVKGRYGQ